MAQTGYTPISLYYSTTAAAVPTNTNLANGELAINITDGKLYYKDNTGTVQLLASSAGSGGSFTNMTVSGNLTLSGGTANGVTYLNGSKVLTSGSALTFDGTTLGVTGPLNLAGTSTFPTSGLMLRSGDNQLKVVAGSAGIAFAAASGASTFATIDSAGNLGLGVTPSAWSGTAFQIKGPAYIASTSQVMELAANGYWNGTNWIYTSSSYAERYTQVFGEHRWSTAPSGTAGNAISFTQAMTLDASGRLYIGAASAAQANENIITGGQGGGIQLIRNVAGSSPTSGQSLGTYAWKGQDSANTNAAAEAMIEAVAAENFSGSTAGTNMLFYTKPSGTGPGSSPTERFRITSAGAWGLAGANYGSAGQVLTSNGSGSAPTWQAGGGGGGSAATPTSLGTVYGTTTASSLFNTGLGYSALPAITSGANNVAVGYSAGNANTTGASNVFVGPYAGYVNLSGNGSVAVGNSALSSNTSGSYNVGVGQQALNTNTTGSYSVAIGYQSLYLANPAVSGFSGDTIAIGYRALYSAGSVASNGSGGCTAVGHGAGQATSTAGNGAYDTFIGYIAGYSNVSGYNCTFVGASAGYGQTSGNSNTIVGVNAGRQTSGAGGSLCTFVGTNAGSSNSGNDNTFVGAAAGSANAGAASNAYFGTYAGISCTGSYNVALGAEAMYSSTATANNVAVGYGALRSMTSASGGHAAVGYQALYSATDNNNAALGYRAGFGVTSGHNNVLIGTNAGNTGAVLTGGAQNVVIGSSAYTSSAGAYNEIVIGQSCNGVGNDYVTIGKLNNRVYNHYDTNATWTQSSDVRLKKDIEDDSLGLSFINKLRPVKYRWKATNELERDNPQYNEVNNKNTTAVMHGLIAQEVKAALDEEGVSTFGGWDIEPNGIQGISREMFITPLINAVQELTAQIETLKAEIAALKGNV